MNPIVLLPNGLGGAWAPAPWRRPATLAYARRPAALGQANVLETRPVSFVAYGAAAAVGVVAGLKLDGFWSTAGWVVGVVAGIRAMNDLFQLK